MRNEKTPMPMRTVTLRMPAADAAKLLRCAKASGQGMAEFVRLWVARLPEPGKPDTSGKTVFEIIGKR